VVDSDLGWVVFGFYGCALLLRKAEDQSSYKYGFAMLTQYSAHINC
jgi:hypothetical protein